MGAFSDSMRTVATDLMTSLGNPCTLTLVTQGQYNPDTGKTPVSQKDYPTFSAPVKKMSEQFAQLGINTNLAGFDTNKVIVPWIGQVIDETWLYDGHNITTVEEIKSQGAVIIYTITIGEK